MESRNGGRRKTARRARRRLARILAESNRTLDNGDPEPYRDFTRVSSEFYPELSKHYERLFDRWTQAYRRTDEESDL
jgi:hypothetical protein